MKQPANIFISYAHKDEEYKDKLYNHLSGLRNSGFINDWNDRQILPGQEWDDQIKGNLEAADIIIFLVSSDFMASNYINDNEIANSMQRHANGEVLIVPVVIRPCDLPSLSISKFQALPKNAQPISTWPNEDEAFLDVVNQLKRLIAPPSAPAVGATAAAISPQVNIHTPPPVNPPAAPTSSSADIIKECKELVAKGKPDKAIKKLLPISQEIDEDIHTQFIMLSGRLESLKKNSMMGTISESGANTTRSQITYALLQVMGDLEDEL